MFFDEKCSSLINETWFCLCDDISQKSEPAFVSVDKNSSWNAEVNNHSNIELTFTAIDNCIDVAGKKCDGMLYGDKYFYLIELKDRKINTDWKKEAKEQLLATINTLKIYNADKLSQFSVKKAYICNKKQKRFTKIDHSEKKAFFEETRFRLDIQATITV